MKHNYSLLDEPLDPRQATFAHGPAWDLSETTGRYRLTQRGTVAVSVMVIARRVDPALRRFPPEVRVQAGGAELFCAIDPRWYGSAGSLIAVFEAELPGIVEYSASVQVDDATEVLLLTHSA
ncbi:hypothetical protein [Paramicrobacterium fandaimingii]|uniref:hypothetical protein n=1 Tax=Paramicrobacterium fandaimingii TaxID=2708079 RepID=UPI0014204295|nr:hypothetical protein [Microbacterium fandaimingii]